jgi:hypothetical protein
MVPEWRRSCEKTPCSQCEGAIYTVLWQVLMIADNRAVWAHPLIPTIGGGVHVWPQVNVPGREFDYYTSDIPCILYGFQYDVYSVTQSLTSIPECSRPSNSSPNNRSCLFSL